MAGGEERVLLPVQVSPAPGESELRVVGAAAGWDITVVVTHDGRVLTWGSNAFSQLGRPDEPREATRVGVVPLPDEVVQVAAGLRHCAALTAGGQLWTWGSDSRGQLTGGARGGGRRAAPARPARGGREDSVGGVRGLPHGVRVGERPRLRLWRQPRPDDARAGRRAGVVLPAASQRRAVRRGARDAPAQRLVTPAGRD